MALTERCDFLPRLGYFLQGYLVLWSRRHPRGQSTTVFCVLLVLIDLAHSRSRRQSQSSRRLSFTMMVHRGHWGAPSVMAAFAGFVHDRESTANYERNNDNDGYNAAGLNWWRINRNIGRNRRQLRSK